jgi:DNA replication and repair protein RecF
MDRSGASLALELLSIRRFRNLTSVDIELGPRFNILSGDNGQGKTNLLEAAYVLATSRSFRTAKLSELVQGSEENASIRARVREDREIRNQSMGLRPGLRAARVDGRSLPTLAAYAVLTPVVVFHPGLSGLSAGSGADRRKLLDRLALYLWPASLADAEGYSRASRARQRVLDVRGESAADLDGWEELMVRHGLALSQARESAAKQLGQSAVQAFARFGPPALSFHTRYDRSAPPDPEAFRALLAKSRPRDRARRSASVGPHRDDLTLELGGRPVRGIASQGQHRAVILALELGEIEVIAQARGVGPILLLDDVSSELDRGRTGALFKTLREGYGQVILTTTRPELVDTADSFGVKDRRDFTVVEGRIAPA